MTALELAHETIEYYKTHERAVDPNSGYCKYYINGDMCAVGRCLIDAKATQEEHSDEGIMTIAAVHSIDDIMKPEYRGLQLYVWSNLQYYHDRVRTEKVTEEHTQKELLKAMSELKNDGRRL